MTKSYTKLKHQVKSSRYYIFWGAATVTITIKMEWDELNKRRGTGPYMPMIDPDDYIIWESID
jgi:hypothetical protein